MLDLNGVVKGKTVDDALALAGRGLGLRRRRPRDDSTRSWSGFPAAARIALHGGGLATLSVAKRSLARGGERRSTI